MLIIPAIAQMLTRWKHYAIVCVTSMSLTIGWSHAGLAQSTLLPPTPAICELNLSLLKSADLGKDRNIVTADTVSPLGSTIPSLWWTNEQFPAKLVTNWIANNNQKQIYLLVNAQAWNILDYVDRYRTIDKFGRAAQDYGYNLKICNSQKVILADYTCGSAGASSIAQPQLPNQNTCQIWLNANGQSGLGVKSK